MDRKKKIDRIKKFFRLQIIDISAATLLLRFSGAGIVTERPFELCCIIMKSYLFLFQFTSRDALFIFRIDFQSWFSELIFRAGFQS